MGDYEKEMRRLQALWLEVENEDEDEIESDGEQDEDNVSINSDYPDIEQEASDFENVQDNPAEVTASTEEDVQNESEDRDKYYVSKNGMK